MFRANVAAVAALMCMFTDRRSASAQPALHESSRPVGRETVVVDAANLLNRTYPEIVGVAMPGRWISAGLRFATAGQ